MNKPKRSPFVKIAAPFETNIILHYLKHNKNNRKLKAHRSYQAKPSFSVDGTHGMHVTSLRFISIFLGRDKIPLKPLDTFGINCQGPVF